MLRPPGLHDAPSRTLNQLSALLRLDGGPLRFAREVCAASEPYELGVALPFVPVGRSSPAVQVYYNPRRRSAEFRERLLDTLSRWGLRVDAARAALQIVPTDAVSTVVGLEWVEGDPRPGATLYLEEIAGLGDTDQRAAALQALAKSAGLPAPQATPANGEAYIWALDLGAGGVERLKLYERVPPGQRSVVRAALQAHVGGTLGLGCDDALFGGTDRAGYLLQHRLDAAGTPALHKVYRSFDYQTPGFDPLHAQRLFAAALREHGASRQSLQLARLVCAPEDGYPLANLALAFARGEPTPLYGTAYVCLARNAQADRPGSGP